MATFEDFISGNIKPSETSEGSGLAWSEFLSGVKDTGELPYTRLGRRRDQQSVALEQRMTAAEASGRFLMEKMLSGLAFVDRPRAANYRALEAETGKAKEEWLKGIMGEGASFSSDDFVKIYAEAKANPEKHPVLKRLLDWYAPTEEIFYHMNPEKKAMIYSSELTPFEKAMAGTAGFIKDLGIDPLTYYGTPLTSLPMALAKQVGRRVVPKSIRTTSGEAMQAAKEAAKKGKEMFEDTKIGDFLFQAFSVKHNLSKNPEFAGLELKFRDVVNRARNTSITENRAFANEVKDLARRLDVDYKELNQFITEGVERGIPNVNLSRVSPQAVDLMSRDKDVWTIVSRLSNKNAEQLKAEIAGGVRIKGLGSDPDKELLEYLIHAITPDGKRAVEKELNKGRGLANRRVYSAQHASTLQRKWRDKSIMEINDAAKAGELEGYKGIIFPDGFFYENPAIAQAIRDTRHRRSMAVVELLTESKNKFGTSSADIKNRARAFGADPEIYKNSRKSLEFLKAIDKVDQDLKFATNEAAYGWAFPSDIATRLDEHYNVMFNPAKINSFIDMADAATSWWKAWTLAPFPAYHTRNLAGNLWNNFVVGVDNPEVYRIAKQIQAGELDKGIPGFVKAPAVPGGKISYEEIRSHVDELGIRGGGLMSVDIETSVASELHFGRMTMGPRIPGTNVGIFPNITKESTPVVAGRHVGMILEDNARIANFVDGLRKGLTLDQAEARVRKTLFDYNELTKIEQEFFRRIMPFYTWSRKNIPFQAEMMLKHPGKYKAVETLRNEIESTTDAPDERLLADWFLSGYPTRVKVNKETGIAEYFLANNWLPAADIWKLASMPGQLFMDMLHPMIKVPIEFAVGESLFSHKKLDWNVKEDLLGFRVSQPIKNMLGNLRVVMELDNFMQAYMEEYPSQGLVPAPEKAKTPEEVLLNFMTGLRTFKVDFDKMLAQVAKEREKKMKEAETRIIRQEFIGLPSNEDKAAKERQKLLDLITKESELTTKVFQ